MDRDEREVFAREITKKYSGFPEWGKLGILKRIPKEERAYKCFSCLGITSSPDHEEEKAVCPECGDRNILIMCPLDTIDCHHDVMGKLAYCPMCGEPVCPECGPVASHSVIQISRITGYLSEVSGWSNHKKQELKDRVRYEVGGNALK